MVLNKQPLNIQVKNLYTQDATHYLKYKQFRYDSYHPFPKPNQPFLFNRYQKQQQTEDSI